MKAFLSLLLLYTWANLTISLTFAQELSYTEDRDGDGVPDYARDKCPNTDRTLEGQEYKVEIDGKPYYVKITNMKANFEQRRRRLLIEFSKLDKEQRALLKPIEGRRDKMSKLSIEDQNRIHELDTLIKEKRKVMAASIYETTVLVDGKERPIELNIGVDEFGCLPDRDGDNVPDIVDKCIDDPGLPIYFGCNDRDGDGVLDYEDECVDVPGLKRLKGCPDKSTGDRDKDGTVDKDDLCPDTPGPKSNKGCPEILTSDEKDIVNKASKVLFDVSKATLRPESMHILDELAALILDKTKKFGTLRIRLEGHTDSDGTAESNLTLSQNRSRAVKDYLVSKGVDINFISTAGYGENQLKINPEVTKADKQENRRVEIAITSEKN
ncbi:MAG: OmpA family protein [Microscillaceae bacterium]|nr:OmpA family protein [Microscillaceae bacterium]